MPLRRSAAQACAQAQTQRDPAQHEPFYAHAGPSAKLEHVTERFAGLWSDLEQEKNQKRIQESQRFSLLQEALMRIEKSVEVSSSKRKHS